MKYALTLLLLVVLATPGLAQCGCLDLDLAMSDDRPYRYRYYLVGRHDTMLAASGVYHWPPKAARTPNSFPRRYAGITLPQFCGDGLQVEVMDSLTKQRMWLTFRYPAVDALAKSLLVDFAAGRSYTIPLDEPLPEFDVTVLDLEAGRGTKWLRLRKK